MRLSPRKSSSQHLFTLAFLGWRISSPVLAAEGREYSSLIPDTMEKSGKSGDELLPYAPAPYTSDALADLKLYRRKSHKNDQSSKSHSETPFDFSASLPDAIRRSLSDYAVPPIHQIRKTESSAFPEGMSIPLTASSHQIGLAIWRLARAVLLTNHHDASRKNSNSPIFRNNISLFPWKKIVQAHEPVRTEQNIRRAREWLAKLASGLHPMTGVFSAKQAGLIPHDFSIRHAVPEDETEIAALFKEWYPITYQRNFLMSTVNGLFCTLVATLRLPSLSDLGLPSSVQARSSDDFLNYRRSGGAPVPATDYIVGLISVHQNLYRCISDLHQLYSADKVDTLAAAALPILNFCEKHSLDRTAPFFVDPSIPVMYMPSLGVVEEVRGISLGMYLMDAAWLELRKVAPNLEYVLLHVIWYNKSAIGLYKRYGFQQHKFMKDHYFVNGKFEDGVGLNLNVARRLSLLDKLQRGPHDLFYPLPQVHGYIGSNGTVITTPTNVPNEALSGLSSLFSWFQKP